jgi:transposase
MNHSHLETFEFVGRTENQARLFFKKYCWKNSRIFCIACRSRKIYRLKGKKYRCKRCGYTFHDFSQRWIGKVRISFKRLLWIIKLFELEVSAHKIALQTGLSYPTVLRICHCIRMALIAFQTDWLLSGEVEVDESYFGGRRKGKRGRGAAGKVPVFGLLERHGKVQVTVVRDVTAESLLNETVKKVRRGSIVYTDRYRGYDALMFCGYRHLCVDHGKYFAAGKVYINGLEGFWSYAKERMAKFHGVSKEYFPGYLNEMAFRYNHRHENIFHLLVKIICNLVQNPL